MIKAPDRRSLYLNAAERDMSMLKGLQVGTLYIQRKDRMHITCEELAIAAGDKPVGTYGISMCRKHTCAATLL